MRARDVAALAIFAATLFGQMYRPGPQTAAFFSDTDDSDQPYALYLPKGYDAARKYPLVVSLHAESSNPRLNLRRVFGRGNLPGETETEATRFFPKLADVDFLVVSPLARGTMGYQGIAEKDVYDTIVDVRKRFSIDPDRIYLTGISMGGGGALWLALTRPDMWAAAAVVCPVAPGGTHELAGNALNLPIQLFQGSADPLVPAANTREWQHQLLQAGAPVEYTEYPNGRHNVWDTAYRNAGIFDWFARYRRVSFPDRVHLSTDRYQYRSAYWFEIDGLTPGTPATADARFTAVSQLTVNTVNFDGFTVHLAGHEKAPTGKPLQITIDGVKLKPLPLPPEGVLSFRRGPHGWQPGTYTPGTDSKRPGMEGPIQAAVGARQLYVYGTADSPSLEELKLRRQEALDAADWNGPRSKLHLAFHIVSDKEVRFTDLDSSDLILFGTKETNQQIGKMNYLFPLELNVSAADYGLLFVYPAGQHLVLVSSGLPWWAGQEEAASLSAGFMPEKPRLLSGLGDYVLFKGNLSNIIAAGRFTRGWKLDPAEQKKLIATGVITTK